MSARTTIDPQHRVVLIKIPRSIPADGDPSALFEATRKWWVISEGRRQGPSSPQYALAVNKGRVVVAHLIERWEPAPAGRRWGFAGSVSKELTALYGGMDVTGYFPPGAANPVRYVNCGEVARAGAQGPAPTALVPEPKSDELRTIIDRLQAEPLTHLMLGHRELFHSNLLAWFFEHQPEIADRVFRPLTSPSALGTEAVRAVHRERKHLDLWLTWPDKRQVVIENKVFSLPDEAQLAEYGTAAADRGERPALWLLSLSDPSWPDDRKEIAGREWRWLSYRDLAERIRSALPPGDRSYESETLRRYANVVDCLSDLVEEVVVGEGSEPVALPAAVREAMGDDRLASTMEKMRAQSVAQRVSAALRTAGISGPDAGSGLTNSQALVGWFVPVGRAEAARAGFQLQGGQFRLALIIPHLKGTDPKSRQARFDFAKANEDLFAFSELDQILGTASEPVMPTRENGTHGFNRYDPDFVYRYKQVPNLTVEQLEAAAVAVARRLGA